MIKIAHNINNPFSFTLEVFTVTRQELAELIVLAMKTYKFKGQWPNDEQQIVSYIFEEGIAINVDHRAGSAAKTG